MADPKIIGAREHLQKILAAKIWDGGLLHIKPPEEIADEILALGMISEKWEVHGPPDDEHPSGWMQHAAGRVEAERSAKRQNAEVRVRYSIEMIQAFPVGDHG